MNAIEDHSAGRLTSWLTIGLAAVLVCVVSLLAAHALGAGLVDDSYIFLRYARNVTSGFGPVFNPGERVEGYSSPLWLALVTMLTASGIDPVSASPVLSGILGLSLPLLILIAFGRRSPGHLIAVFPPAAFLATHPSVAFWSWTGMDTSLFALLSLLTLVLVLHRSPPNSRNLTMAGFAYALSAIARFEALVLLPVYLLYLIATNRKTPRRILQLSIRFLAPMVLVVAGFVVRRIYYGSWLPNTFYAKADIDRSVLIERGTEYIRSFGAANLIPLAVLALLLTFALVRGSVRRAPILLAVGLGMTLTTATVFVGGDHFPLHRFLVPVLAFTTVSLASGSCDFARSYHQVSGFRGAFVVLALLGVTQFSNYCIFRESAADSHAEVKRAELWSEVGRWFKSTAGPNDTLASIVVGAIPYYSGLTCIDLLGLTDETIARKGDVHLEGAVGHQRYDTAYVLSRRPTFIVFNRAGQHEDVRLVVNTDFAYALWDLLQDPRTVEWYRLRVVTMSNRKILIYLELADHEPT